MKKLSTPTLVLFYLVLILGVVFAIYPIAPIQSIEKTETLLKARVC